MLLYLLISGWSEHANEGLAKKMLLMNLAADLAILIGLTGVVIAAARTSGAESGVIPQLNYSLSDIVHEFPRLTTDDVSAQEYWKHAQRSLLTILVLAALVKALLFPFMPGLRPSWPKALPAWRSRSSGPGCALDSISWRGSSDPCAANWAGRPT